MKKKAKRTIRHHFFMLAIFCLAFFFSITSALALYEQQFSGKIYPGIKVDDIDLSVMRKSQVEKLFEAKNKAFENVTFTLRGQEAVATVSGKELELGFNAKLIADQAYAIGRTGNVFADTFNKLAAWFGGINLPASYRLKRTSLEEALSDITNKLTTPPIDAVFEMAGNKVISFRPSQAGLAVDIDSAQNSILSFIPKIHTDTISSFEVIIPIVIVTPKITLEETNNLGIKEHIGQGISKFAGSIPNRIHNVALAASRIDGTIVKDGETFSFNDTVGDVSKLTGYKEAYIIKDGKTILGDGGGVCQVSTTLFRAVLASGLPVKERHAHAYRVSYYEQDSPPGFDATVYSPSYDFRFLNDSGHAILIKAYADTVNTALTFDFYGTSDNRQVFLTKPIVSNQTPPPHDLYQDDPTLPKNVVKQVDFKAFGASVVFSRTVKKGGQVLLSDSYTSNFRPWQAVFLRGTKEN